jgi:hypothetical protein
MSPASRSCAGRSWCRRGWLNRDRGRDLKPAPGPRLNGGANMSIIADDHAASHDGFLPQSTSRHCAPIFVATNTNRCVVLIFALSGTGCLPSNVHWNNLQPCTLRRCYVHARVVRTKHCRRTEIPRPKRRAAMRGSDPRPAHFVMTKTLHVSPYMPGSVHISPVGILRDSTGYPSCSKHRV